MIKVCLFETFNFKGFKNLHFCQKRSLNSFSPTGRLTKWAKFDFLSFSSFRDFTKRAAHILSFWIFEALNCKRPYFCQKMSLSSFSPNIFQFLSILDEFCGADIINGTSKCKTFVDKCCKQQSLGGLYLCRKAKLFPVSLHFRRNLWCRHHQWNI